MNPFELKQDLSANQGFFTLTLSDGRTFTVEYTDYILISPSGEHASFYPREGGLRMLDVRQITSIEFAQNKAK
jgi:hypothetical protein